MRRQGQLYIGGEWVASAGERSIAVVNPATEEVIATVPEGTAEDVDRAVRAARVGVPGVVGDAGRRARPPASALRDGLAERQAELAATHHRRDGRAGQGGRHRADGAAAPGARLLHRAGRRRRRDGDRSATRWWCASRSAWSAAITPWNYPLHQSDRQDRAGAARRVHGGAQAERGRAAVRARPRRGRRRTSAFPPACTTWCRAPAPSSARRSRSTRTSTWCRSPGRRAPAGG